MRPSPSTDQTAFRHWLQNGLSEQYAETLNEPIPPALLALLAAPPERN